VSVCVAVCGSARGSVRRCVVVCGSAGAWRRKCVASSVRFAYIIHKVAHKINSLTGAVGMSLIFLAY
jgi:hypothetical protein